MIERSHQSSPTLTSAKPVTSSLLRKGQAHTLPALWISAFLMMACGTSGGSGGGTGGVSLATGGGGGTGSGGLSSTGGTGAGATGGVATGGLTSGGGDGRGSGGATGGVASTGGADGGASSGGASGGSGGGSSELAPANLSETGLFTERDSAGELVLADGVRAFEPKYWLWSDGADKRRYVYLPPGKQIDTTDPDHWVLPAGTKLWKSFISSGQLVETRLIERTGDGPTDFRFTTYFWMTADAADAVRMDYKNLLLNAAGTTHDIPNGMMCERCHNTLKERAAGFGALQLNHDRGGVTLKTLLDENLLTVPIALDIGMPGPDQATQDALGYLHANCGNCHNDSPGLLVESVPAPQLLLRGSVHDKTLEDTDVYLSAINQRTTASSELAIDYRIFGGSEADSAIYFRMTQRMIEDQMPPIGTELQDADGLALLATWIKSLPPPAP